MTVGSCIAVVVPNHYQVSVAALASHELNPAIRCDPNAGSHRSAIIHAFVRAPDIENRMQPRLG